MKKIASALLLALMAYFPVSCDDENLLDQSTILGYWYKDLFIELTPQNNGQYLILARPTDNPVSNDVLRAYAKNCNAEFAHEYGDTYWIKTKKRPSDPHIYVSDFYLTPDRLWYFVRPEISIEPKSGAEINKIVKKYKDIFTLKEHREDWNIYRYSCNVGTSLEMLEILRDIHDNFASSIERCWVDGESEIRLENTYYQYQYYINSTSSTSLIKDLRVEEAWQMVTGSPDITVAVIDDGVEHNHEDMLNCVLSGYTAENPSGNGNPQNENQYNPKGHGTACAGIIAVEDNTIGIKGIAHGVKILPVNVFPNYATNVNLCYFHAIIIFFSIFVLE